MRFHIFVFLFFCAFTLVRAEPERIPEKYQIDGYKEFRNLSRQDALTKGKKLASGDFEQGIYRMLVYGLRRMDSPEEKWLQAKYSVYTIPIAGCMVSDGILGAAEGYNTTMKDLLAKKFGKDVFEEAKQAKP